MDGHTDIIYDGLVVNNTLCRSSLRATCRVVNFLLAPCACPLGQLDGLRQYAFANTRTRSGFAEMTLFHWRWVMPSPRSPLLILMTGVQPTGWMRHYSVSYAPTALWLMMPLSRDFLSGTRGTCWMMSGRERTTSQKNFRGSWERSATCRR